MTDSVKGTKELVKEKSEKELVHDQIVTVLKEYNNKESEIPLNHQYWDLVNQYRGMK